MLKYVLYVLWSTIDALVVLSPRVWAEKKAAIILTLMMSWMPTTAMFDG